MGSDLVCCSCRYTSPLLYLHTQGLRSIRSLVVGIVPDLQPNCRPIISLQHHRWCLDGISSLKTPCSRGTVGEELWLSVKISTSIAVDAMRDSSDASVPGRNCCRAQRRLGLGLKSNKQASPFCKPNI